MSRRDATELLPLTTLEGPIDKDTVEIRIACDETAALEDGESQFIGNHHATSHTQNKSFSCGFHQTYVCVFGALMTMALVLSLLTQIAGPSIAKDRPRNLIMMVPDGFGPSSVTYGRLRSREFGRAFALDSILVGTSRTYSSNSLVTDSAAGATAFSCGIKTYNHAIAVDSLHRPCPTILEAAQAKGMKVGIVVTSRITHATPAAFSAHVPDRNMEEEIAQQQVSHKIDVLLGGGAKFYKPSIRSDGRDLIQEAKSIYGAEFVDNAADLKKIMKTPVLGLFADDHIAYDIDRQSATPSLLEMVQKAIKLLNQDNQNGFFLLIEGSRMDHAGHLNDPVGHSSEIVMYDRVVEAVLEFARADGNTLMISVADHETGGFSLGRANMKGKYAWYPEEISKAKHSTEWMSEEAIKNYADPILVFEDNTGISLSAEEKSELQQLFESVKTGKQPPSAYQMWMGQKISSQSLLSWTTGMHTGVDVNIYAYGPNSQELRGNHENFYVGKVMEKYLNVDLSKMLLST